LSQEKQPETRILPSRIAIELSELSARQRKSVLGLIKEIGFVPEEISEIAVIVNSRDPEEPGAPGAVVSEGGK